MRTVKCDQCGADLTSSEGMPGFRLHLSVFSIPITGGIVYAVMVYPPIERDVDFCGKKCLKDWMEKTK